MRHLFSNLVSVVAAIATAVMPLASQSPPAQKPSFEVASIKRSPPDARGSRVESSGGRFLATNVTLRLLVVFAFNRNDGVAFLNNRVIGGPSWIDTDHFDIEAKTDEASAGPIPRDKLQPMLQSLLEDRFQLQARREMREMPVYLLTVGRGGPKLKLSEDQSPYAPQPPNTPIEQRRGIIRRTADGTSANAVSLGPLTSFLSSQTGRPVLDKTDLKGMFDFKLNWVPPPVPFPGAPAGPEVALPTASDPGASIFTAIQELGLKLESAKAPLEVLVIDSVQKPSEN